MKIEILRNCFKPSETARAHTALIKGSTVELEDSIAEKLIESGHAAEVKEKKVEKPEKAEKKVEKPEKAEKKVEKPEKAEKKVEKKEAPSA